MIIYRYERLAKGNKLKGYSMYLNEEKGRDEINIRIYYIHNLCLVKKQVNKEKDSV